MQAKYLLLFRAVLGETLLLQALYAPDASARRPGLWTLFAGYAAMSLALYACDRRGRLKTAWAMGSFLLDIGVTSAVLVLAGGVAGDFYVAYFLVILGTCFLDNLAFSFLVGGLACLVYGALAFPEGAAFQPFYLLRLSLLLVTSFFSSYMVDHARSLARQTAESYEQKLAWMQRLSMVGRAVAGILHEAKTPLGTILLNVEQVKEKLGRGRDRDVKEELDLIAQETERAAALLSDFLEFSKPSDLVLAPLALKDPLDRALATARLRLKDRGIRLETSIDQGLRVEGSERHLVQVFNNLLVNAVEAMPLGGELRVSARGEGDWVQVRVADTGAGLDPNLKDRVFEPFVTGKGEGGHGLGLSIAHWIVEKHGGSISLASDGPGQGAVASVLLRRAPKS